MKTNPNRFWFIVIALAWTFDFLFWKKPFGVNFVIFVTLCLTTGIFLLRADGLRLSPRSNLLLFPIAFLSALTFFRLEPMTVFLSVVMTLSLMGVFAMTYLGGRWLHYGLLDYLFGYFRLAGSMIVRPLGFAADVFDAPPGSEGYSPLRRLNLVTWNDPAAARELKSVTEVLEAEANGEVAIEQPGVVINMPFVVWDGGKR